MKQKILFIYHEEGMESLAIEYLSATLKEKGHETDLIIEFVGEKDFKVRLKEKINEFKPDFIGFSVWSYNYLWACELSKYLKQISKAKIIFGGIHVTSCPEEVMKNKDIDYVVLGEGEETIIDIVENPDKKHIPGAWLRWGEDIIKNPMRRLLLDLDKLPIPDKEPFLKKAPYLREKYYCVVGRGCPFGCTFCFNNYMKKLYHGQKWVRKRSVNHVIKELEAMKKTGYKMINFMDDCLTDNIKWLKEFKKEYVKHINIEFAGISHPAFLSDEVCKILKQTGCVRMQIGTQTPIESKRKEICKRYDTNKMIQIAVDNLKNNGIMVYVDHIFKLPKETVEEYQEGLEFYINLKPDVFSCFVLQYYPNIEITDIALKEGILTEEMVKSLKLGQLPKNLTKEQIKKRLRDDQVSIFTSLKDPENKELLNIYRFIHWIPVLPRFLSRFIVRKKLYPLFFADYLNKIPFLLKYLSKPFLIKEFFMTLNKKKILKEVRMKYG